MTRAVKAASKRTRPAKVLAAAFALQRLVVPAVKTKSSAKKAPVSAKPRVKRGESTKLTNKVGGNTRTLRPLVPTGATFTQQHYADEHGKRSYKLFVPAVPRTSNRRSAKMPLLIMLHGCGQTPDDFALGTGMNGLAAEHGLIVAYPAQPRTANRNGCWNWFAPAHQSRDSGEPALIAGIARQILGANPADPGRVYIAGLSAGGAAALNIALAYPELFAAVGVHSGLPKGAAHDKLSAALAMGVGSAGQPQTSAVPTIVFHGDADKVVNPRNGRSVVGRAVAAFDELVEMTKSGRAPGGHRFQRLSYRAKNRKSYGEHWLVKGAGHGWSGGNPAGNYTASAGPDASLAMLRFFRQHRISGPAAPAKEP